VGRVISNAFSGLCAQLSLPNVLSVDLIGVSLPLANIVSLQGDTLAPASHGLDTLLVAVLQRAGAQIVGG
jgi:hypothetical protein